MTRAPAVLGCLALASSAAWAAPLTMHRSERARLEHTGPGRFTMEWEADFDVTANLRKGGKLTVVSTGRSVDRVASDTGTDEDGRQWKTTWTGTWSIARDTLHLALVLVDHTCKRAKTSAQFAPETMPCDAAAKRAELTCTTETLPIWDPDTSVALPSISAWRCNARSDVVAESAGSMGSWVFDKAGCLRSIGGHHALADQYGHCTP